MELKNQIKGILFDFDGTLVDYEEKASSYTMEALHKLRENGYALALSSGRPTWLGLHAVENSLKENPFDYYFGANGSEFWDVKNDKKELLKSFGPEEISEINRMFPFDFLTLAAYQEYEVLFNKPLTESTREFAKKRFSKATCCDFDHLDVSVSKLIALLKKEDKPKLDAQLREFENCDCFYSHDTLLEIAPKGVSKKLTVDKMASILNCSPENIMAFGDGENDLDMLRNCIGVAMGNAKPVVKQHCRYQCDDIHSTGIYSFLKEEGFF